MSAGVYIEKTVGMSHEKAFEAVKRAVLEKYTCRVIKEEPPYILVVEQLPTPWKYKPPEAPKYITFHLYPVGQSFTKIIATSTLHHEYTRRVLFSYIGIGALIVFLYFIIISMIAGYVRRILDEDFLATLVLLMPPLLSVILIIAGIENYRSYKHKDDIAKSVLESLS